MKLAYRQDVLINGDRCYVFSVEGFAAENFDEHGADNGEDRETYIANKTADEIKRWGMHMAYQFTRHSTTLTSDRGYYEREQAKWANAPELSVGDVVELDGKKFTIVAAPNNNYGLDLVV